MLEWIGGLLELVGELSFLLSLFFVVLLPEFFQVDGDSRELHGFVLELRPCVV
jgi:hypothetical protein